MRILNKIKAFALVMLLMTSLNLTSAQGDNPFIQSKYWAAKPSIETIKADMVKGHSVLEANGGGFDATTYAILNNNPLSTVQFLVEQGNSVNKRTHDSRTYIFWAASRANIEVMEYLMAQGAKTDLRDSHGYTVAQFAAAGGQQSPEIYDFFEANGMDLKNQKTTEGKNILHILIPRLTNYGMLDYFQVRGFDLNELDENGNGLFNYAARSGNIELLEELVDRGVKFGENKVTGENAILMASSNRENTVEYFKYLEALGLNPAVKTNEAVSALHRISASNNNLAVYNYFLSKGLNVNDADSNGNTPLINAASRNSLEMISFLAEQTTNINSSNKEGQTALTMAVARNSPAVVDYLISKGADVNVIDEKGNSLGQYLISGYSANNSSDFDHKLRSLRAKALDLNKKQGDKSTLFHLAIDKNDLDLLKKVNALNIDVNAKNNEGATVLHLAAMKAADAEILKYLISIGADKTSTTEFEETAFDLAQENEKLRSKKEDLEFLKAK
ncbi:ankyrin repeat domain-containing protein [Roseivirga echinicomitans]